MQEFIEDMQSVIKRDVIVQMQKFVQNLYIEIDKWGESIEENCEDEMSATLCAKILSIVLEMHFAFQKNLAKNVVTKESAYEFLFQMTEIASSVFDVEKVLLYDDIIKKEKNTLTEYLYVKVSGFAIILTNQ